MSLAWVYGTARVSVRLLRWGLPPAQHAHACPTLLLALGLVPAPLHQSCSCTHGGQARPVDNKLACTLLSLGSTCVTTCTPGAPAAQHVPTPAWGLHKRAIMYLACLHAPGLVLLHRTHACMPPAVRARAQGCRQACAHDATCVPFSGVGAQPRCNHDTICFWRWGAAPTRS